jgi:hypothetical protein
MMYLKVERAKIITSKWAMKKKASGASRVRLNARGFEPHRQHQ